MYQLHPRFSLPKSHAILRIHGLIMNANKKEVLSKLSSWRKKLINQDLRKAYHNTKAAWKRLIRMKNMSSQKWNVEILKKAKSNPKSFWNAINSSAASKAVDNNNSCSEWEQYFRYLYSTASSPQVTAVLASISDPSSTHIISNPNSNSPMNQEPNIPTDEIGLAISKLKCGKAPGTDLLTNEALKSLPLLVRVATSNLQCNLTLW